MLMSHIGAVVIKKATQPRLKEVEAENSCTT